jgi:hypothetical protein
MFSATVKSSTSMKCWWTMPMRSSMALRGESMCWGSPLTRISPSSGCSSPYSIFIRVDLPAPFSPTRAWISPSATSRSMWSLATTPA